VATYYDIFGQKVQYLSSDPANLTEGQVWYNSTSGEAKVRGVTSSNTWASGANHPQGGPGRYISYSAGFGTQTAGVSAGGYNPTIANVTHYDGSTWTASTSLPSANNSTQGNGTQTAGFLFGGNPGTFNLNYDGSTWTTVGSMFSPSQAESGWFSAGTQTAVLAARAEPPIAANETYTWDGATWTSSPGVLNTGRNTSGGSRCGSGTSSSAIFASGNTPTPVGSTLLSSSEEWDGTCFTSGNPVNTACRGHMVTGTSITDALKSQGNLNGGTFSNSTELYDGTCWSTTSNAPYARTYTSGFGGAGLGLNFGGDTEGIPPTTVNTTIEWTGTFESTNAITTS
jgi:hypothetical protein